jgi:hypothetical protein
VRELIVVAALAILLAKPMGYLPLFALIPLDASIAPAAPFPCAYRKQRSIGRWLSLMRPQF